MTKKKSAFIRTKSLLLISFTTLWLVLCLPAIGFSQNQPKQHPPTDTVNNLQEIVIRAQKLNKRQTSSTPLQILSGEDLQRLNTLSVADAVRFFSGVQLKDYGGIGGLKTINVRSMGTNHTAVFYDGVQLGNAQNGQIDLGKYSLDNIEEIELYSGQKSAIFQSAKGFAAASSLYLKAKQPVFKPGESNQYKATLKGGSFGLLNPSLLWQHKISNQLSSSINTEYRKAHGRYSFNYSNGVYDTTAVRSNGDIESLRLEASLYAALPDSSSWSAKVYAYNDAQGLPGAIVANKFDYTQRMWNRNFFLQSAYQKDGQKYSLQAAFKYANDYLRYLDPEFVSEKGLLNNKFHQQELYASIANKYHISNIWTAVLSADYQFNTLDANLDYFPYPDRHTLLGALATQVQWNKLDVQANVLGTFVSDQVEQFYSAGKKTKLSPTILLSWQPFHHKEFRLRGFYKSIFRMPTFNDLYYTFIGNSKLRPEYTKQYDLGFTYIRAFQKTALRQFSIQADGYYNQVKDKIVAVPGANLFRWSMQNLEEVEIKGLDVNIQSDWVISKDLHLNAGLNYTYQDAKDTTPGEYAYARQIPYTPLHSGSLMAGADWKRWSVNYSYIYTGERYNQKANTIYNYVQPWYTHDLALHYSTRLYTSQLRISAEVNNVLNQYYDVIANFPMPGRNYRFTLSYTL